MMKVFVNIKKLLQITEENPKKALSGKELSACGSVDNAYLIVSEGRIAGFGKMEDLHGKLGKLSGDNGIKAEKIETVDVKGRMILPAFCDSHTHLVYAGSREQEFIDKVKGLSYQEIARRGGGILNSAKLLHETSEDELFSQALVRANEIISFGTGAVEIKSGYGLNTEDEIKMLRVAKRIGEVTPLTVKTTFLGAHAVPGRYSGNREGYVDEIIGEMIPEIASLKLADYIDVFTEDGFFSVRDTERIFEAGLKYGLTPKVHANQMSTSGGVQVGVKYGAISVDHLESTAEEEFKVLKESATIATLLPGSSFFLNMEFAPARAIIDYGIPVALATNYNPGSSPSGNMKFMLSLAVLKMKMLPEEALNAATINGAFAMGLGQTHGSVTVGKRADFIITNEIPSPEYIPYAYSSLLVHKLYLAGKEVHMQNIII